MRCSGHAAAASCGGSVICCVPASAAVEQQQRHNHKSVPITQQAAWRPQARSAHNSTHRGIEAGAQRFKLLVARAALHVGDDALHAQAVHLRLGEGGSRQWVRRAQRGWFLGPGCTPAAQQAGHEGALPVRCTPSGPCRRMLAWFPALPARQGGALLWFTNPGWLVLQSATASCNPSDVARALGVCGLV